ncbi:MAG: hypothetical protein AMXMBFR45_19940 [Gammaproteobacteria bacterium]|nr:MAG: hypothetical protein EDM71_00425 [Pseudomonadota bacterium]MCL4776140.1 AAA family ATPase [Gammaproteobacteria bacterium]GIK34092.1 MAG: hypothetical protein BroJett010_06510 [Gammaproteobacteria bacterium]
MTPDAAGAETPQNRLDWLLASGAFGPLAADFRVIETHVSWVILSGDIAYKLKKPVDLGFLDFRSLAARRQACEEELRLNRRLAPDIYLGVVAVSAVAGDGTGSREEAVVEYAVKMRRFPPGAAVGAELAAGLKSDEAARLGELIGQFHRELAPAPPGMPWGSADSVWSAIVASLAQLDATLGASWAEQLAQCRRYISAEFSLRRGFVLDRQRCGAVRECHGDLHLGNLVRLGNRVVPFDALEFDPALRWIDVMNEMAFLIMDLDVRGRRDLAFQALNGYLDITGDFAGLAGLRLYLSYRALVRAKVASLSPIHASDGPGMADLLAYAAKPLAGTLPILVVMAGVSGSGKSWLARQLSARLFAIHIRSDVERKRLFAMAPLARTDSAPGTGIYAADVSARVYARMADLAATVLESGLPVILDATSLRQAQRSLLLAAARRTGHPAVVVACSADAKTLVQRVARRASEARDPSEASIDVLQRQLAEFEPPGSMEGCYCVCIDTTNPLDLGALVTAIGDIAGTPIRDAAHGFPGTTPGGQPKHT